MGVSGKSEVERSGQSKRGYDKLHGSLPSQDSVYKAHKVHSSSLNKKCHPQAVVPEHLFPGGGTNREDLGKLYSLK